MMALAQQRAHLILSRIDGAGVHGLHHDHADRSGTEKEFGGEVSES